MYIRIYINKKCVIFSILIFSGRGKSKWYAGCICKQITTGVFGTLVAVGLQATTKLQKNASKSQLSTMTIWGWIWV
jgi:hypothetical protein